jgi:dipeptidyl aminopeptidase/acylaminoacyl peptidase
MFAPFLGSKMYESTLKFSVRNIICSGLLTAFYAAGQAPAAPPAKPQPKPHPADAVLQQEGYAMPPAALAEAVTAPRNQNVSLASLSPSRAWYLNEIGDGPVSIAVMSKPFHELGGLFVDFRANRSRALTIRNNVGLQFISPVDGAKRTVQLQAGSRISNATWSPDGNNVAFFMHTNDATHIWVADAATARARQLTKKPVLATLVTGISFSGDGKHVFTVLIPDNRQPMPAEPAAATGPSVYLAEDLQRRRLRTFASLMSTAYEHQLFEWHITGQLTAIDIATGAARKIGEPKMIRSINPSVDGKHAIVTTVAKPFSYSVPFGNFGSVEEIWGEDGKALAKLGEQPLNIGTGAQGQGQGNNPDEPGPGGQNQQTKREISWRTDGHGLTFLEQDPPPPPREGGRAADNADGGAAPAAPPQGARAAGRPGGPGGQGAEGGTPGAAAARRDKVKQWLPPFGDGDVKVIYEHSSRMTGHRFSPDMNIVFFSERAGQDTAKIAVYLDEPAKRYTLARYRANDQDANPGTMLGARNRGVAAGAGRGGGRGPASSGPVLLSADGSAVFFAGTVYDKDPQEVAPKAYVDRVEIKTGEKKRIFEGDNNGVSERVAAALDPDNGTYILARSSPSQPTQFFRQDGGKRVQLTQNKDLFPDMTRAKKQRFMVERADGFKFRVIVTLPENYVEGTKLPAFFWFYPSEFATQEDYDRTLRTYNKNEFANYGTSAKQFFVRLGYAVVEPDIPIVGPAGQMNNNYPHDLRNTLSAVIDDLDKRNIIDRARLGIGGHSYGAFSTVNAMVQTPFFKAGIAGDGAYNRTLTPLGFQSERRDFWEARETYLAMSPFLYANNMTGALLMYHGKFDQNVGTDPINSSRLFHALSGLGKPASLYLYPLEDHGPAAKETLLDLWARQAAWLDKYVMNPAKPEPAGDKSE